MMAVQIRQCFVFLLFRYIICRGTDDIPSLNLTHLKHWGWKMSFLLGWPLCSGQLLVSVRLPCCMGDLAFSFLLRCSSQSRGLASSSSSLAMKECWKSGYSFNDIVDGKNPANQLIWVFPKKGVSQNGW